MAGRRDVNHFGTRCHDRGHHAKYELRNHKPGPVHALLQHLAVAPTRGLAATKRALQLAAGNSLEAQLDVERDAQRELGRSDDYREGVSAFAAKRAPKFTGK